ncbi:MAG: hypothetical protein JWM41_4903 [Gemmatimonadetes bacterium]|nr:hypothetical protein [Gemmatimonadota bacterium]
MASLLAVDVGVRTGLASFDDDGRLRWYRSQNFGSAARLRRALPALLTADADLSHVVLEGGGAIADSWESEATKRHLEVTRVTAEEWRSTFLLPREQRSGAQAKETAGRLARAIIDWSDARRPTSLRHDAAEAIMIGLWGALHLRWLRRLPPGLLR